MKKNRIAKTRFMPVLNAAGLINFTFAKDQAGVYIIKRKDEIVYVGMSDNDLYNAARRHFYDYNDADKQVRHTFKRLSDLTIRIVLIDKKHSTRVLDGDTVSYTKFMEIALRKKYIPRLNLNKKEVEMMKNAVAEKAYQDYLDSEVFSFKVANELTTEQIEDFDLF